MMTGNDGTFRHDEADVTIVLEAAKSSQSVIRIDVFVLPAYWMNQADMQRKVQME